ncbi:DNA-binding protein [Mycobacteroides abscessus subsp. abscessus]|nr:DNA-binding protein [Mycobacteroides abscessus subsp. abscessus]
MGLRRVAEATDIDKSVLQRVEQGERACRVTELLSLATVYQVAPATLIRRITAAIEENEHRG